jgi:hypothetical protein
LGLVVVELVLLDKMVLELVAGMAVLERHQLLQVLL